MRTGLSGVVEAATSGDDVTTDLSGAGLGRATGAGCLDDFQDCGNESRDHLVDDQSDEVVQKREHGINPWLVWVLFLYQGRRVILKSLESLARLLMLLAPDQIDYLIIFQNYPDLIKCSY